MNSPSYTPIPYQENPQSLAQALSHLEGFIWLDSGYPYIEEAHKKNNARFDLIAALPSDSVKLDVEDTHRAEKALAFIKQNLSEQDFDNTTAELPFSGGIIGYVGYEWLHEEFRIKPITKNYSTPLVYLAAISCFVLIDHHKKQAGLIAKKEDINKELFLSLIASASMESNGFTCNNFSSDSDRPHYNSCFNKIVEYILQGDCYQVNYAQRFSSRFSGSPFEAYLRLRRQSPSPYSAFIQTDHGAILSFSPERFITCDGSRAQTQPIKGSAPRSENTEKDKEIKKNLNSSKKNHAENLMIVDLLRNDFSKACEPFSVKTENLFDLQSFKNVHHLVSTVTGIIKPSFTSKDLFFNCFPGGSITGAPKKRAMEIINELETYQRHIYCGSILYFSSNGKMDSNIAIRTLLIENDSIYCWGGGGIVADSIAEDEYNESIYKIEMLLKALAE